MGKGLRVYVKTLSLFYLTPLSFFLKNKYKIMLISFLF